MLVLLQISLETLLWWGFGSQFVAVCGLVLKLGQFGKFGKVSVHLSLIWLLGCLLLHHQWIFSCFLLNCPPYTRATLIYHCVTTSAI